MADEVELMDIVPVSTTDWRGHCSTVVFFANCPLNCVYCSNHGMLNSDKFVDVARIEDEIMLASKFVDSVVFSGGEPLMHLNVLKRLCDFAHDHGLKTAIHTNGFYPDALYDLLMEKKLDGVMLDIKAPLYDEKYGEVVGIKNFALGTGRIYASVRHLSRLDIKPAYYEVRTVVFHDINYNMAAIQSISDIAKNADVYVLVQGISEIAPKPIREISHDELMWLAKASIHKNTWIRSKVGEHKFIGQQV